MAKDYLNVIERALMMGISDKIKNLTGTGDDVYVYGQFPETEELKFPAVIIQQVGMICQDFIVKKKGDLSRLFNLVKNYTIIIVRLLPLLCIQDLR